jgi:hypothetical protein
VVGIEESFVEACETGGEATLCAVAVGCSEESSTNPKASPLRHGD